MRVPSDKPIDRILHDLQERAKELNCLYRVDELLGRVEATLDDVLGDVIRTLPAGWQFPDVCVARIVLGQPGVRASGLRAVAVQDDRPRRGAGRDRRAGRGLLHGGDAARGRGSVPRRGEEAPRRDQRAASGTSSRGAGCCASWPSTATRARRPRSGGWCSTSCARPTARCSRRLGRKMINHLCWNGVEEAERLLRSTVPARTPGGEESFDDNRPQPRADRAADPETTDAAFRIAGRHLPEDEILGCIQSWIKEDKSTFLKNALERMDTPLAELADALQRFRHGGVEETDLSTATQMGLRAALVRRFLTDQLEFVNIAKEYLDGRGLPRAVPAHRLPAAEPRPPRRQGGRPLPRLADRGALARVQGDARRHPAPAQLVHPLRRHPRLHPPQRPRGRLQPQVRGPRPGAAGLPATSSSSSRTRSSRRTSCAGSRTCSTTSTAGPSSCAARASSRTAWAPPSRASTRASSSPTPAPSASGSPRSPTRSPRCTPPSSARTRSSTAPAAGSSTSTRRWASSSRRWSARGSGPYWMPAFSGVGFSNNEFRWSARIQREDGLLRIVPGLGTRAVDRLADDYPVLIAPGQPGPAREPDARRGAPLLAEEGRRHQPRDGGLRDRRHARARSSGTATRCRSCAR